MHWPRDSKKKDWSGSSLAFFGASDAASTFFFFFVGCQLPLLCFLSLVVVAKPSSQ